MRGPCACPRGMCSSCLILQNPGESYGNEGQAQGPPPIHIIHPLSLQTGSDIARGFPIRLSKFVRIGNVSFPDSVVKMHQDSERFLSFSCFDGF